MAATASIAANIPLFPVLRPFLRSLYADLVPRQYPMTTGRSIRRSLWMLSLLIWPPLLVFIYPLLLDIPLLDPDEGIFRRHLPGDVRERGLGDAAVSRRAVLQ